MEAGRPADFHRGCARHSPDRGHNLRSPSSAGRGRWGSESGLNYLFPPSVNSSGDNEESFPDDAATATMMLPFAFWHSVTRRPAQLVNQGREEGEGDGMGKGRGLWLCQGGAGAHQHEGGGWRAANSAFVRSTIHVHHSSTSIPPSLPPLNPTLLSWGL